MVTVFTIQTPEDVQHVSTDLHDVWFDIETIRHWKAERLFAILGSRRTPTAEWFSVSDILVVVGADSYEIRDTEAIQCYDLNSLELNDNLLQFRFNIPLSLVIKLAWT